MKRKQFTKEFKLQALHLLEQGNKPGTAGPLLLASHEAGLNRR